MKALFLLVTIIMSCQSTGQKKINGHGVVSSAHPLATNAGMAILKNGGNAFDAAVAIASTLNVVEPMMSGMGGYGTILIYDAKEKQVRYLDSSGKIPSGTNADLMRPPTPDYLQNRRGAKAVSTPGNVNAWKALSNYGNLEWKELFATSIDLAENGFEVSPGLSRFIQQSFNEFSVYTRGFYGKNGSPLRSGDHLIQKDLANSLRIVSQSGPAYFYKGAIAEAIGNSMEIKDGFLSVEDLFSDQAEWWDPIRIEMEGFTIYTASPPATAFPSLIRLGLMDGVDYDHNSADYLHLFAESTKHAFWSRLRYAGDPEINPPPLDRLLSKEYLESVRTSFSMNTASVFAPPLSFTIDESKNTTHFVVADQWGNIVTATQTLGNLFGSKIMPEATGIWLNNSLAYCTYEPKGNPMDAIPGQRKLSGDCPTIIMKDGLPWAALGTPGGHTIGQNVPQIVLNLIKFSMDIDEAIASPKVTFVEPNWLYIENGISDEIEQTLSEKGHNIRRTKRIGNAHGLRVFYIDGKIDHYQGAADRRGEGVAKSY